MNIIDKTDEELEAVAFPMWEDLIKYSNKGQYGKFILNFSYDLLLGLNEVELGKQFAKSELTRNLMKEYDFLQVLAALSIIGKNVKDELEQCLKLRNSCGHPNSLKIGEHKVASHIEILILNVYSKYSI